MKSDNIRAAVSYIAAVMSAAAAYFLLPMLAVGMELTLIEYYMLNAVQLIFLFAVPALLILQAKKPRRERFCTQWRALSAETTGYCMLLAVASTVVVSLVVELWLPVAESVLGPLPADVPLPIPTNVSEWLMSLLCLAVIPAAGEEIFFRGFLQTTVSRYFPRGAVWGVSLVFAALHLDIAAFPGLFVIGLLLGKTMEKRGLGAAVLLHALYNAAVLLLNARNAQISGMAVWLCIIAFVFSVRRLMREDETHAVDGTGM